MPRSPLTETIKRAEGMVHYVQENLSAEEYMLFLDMVDPLPEPAKKPQKKSSKKSAGGGGRSRRGEALKQQIQTARPALDGGVSKMRCAMENCGEYADNNVHHLTTNPDYHPFVSPAQPVEPQSTTDSSATAKAAAGDVHHAANSGD